jgi:hypothetical protein
MTFQSLPPAGRQLETASVITLVVVITIVFILCLCFAMPCTEGDEEGDASQSPSMTTPMKTSRNSGGCHGEPDSETESEEEESDLAQQCYKAKGKSRKVSGRLKYEIQKTWDTWPESTLERADIDNQILQRKTKFMSDSQLFKTPGHKPKKD